MRSIRYQFVLVVSLATALASSQALADVVNVDFAASGADATHSGADGVLSGSGTVWNGVLYNVTSSDVADENGAATPVDIIPTAFFSGGTDGNATNDLQDSGVQGNGFDIGDLVSGSTYDLAVYGGQFMGFGIEDASGFTGGPCTASPTYSLPGTSGSDYCTFSGLEPFDLGGGVMGIRVSSLDGLITGFQIVGTFTAGPGPNTTPALGPLAVGLLVLSIGGASAVLLRRRTRAG